MSRRNPPARYVLPDTVNPAGRKTIIMCIPDEPHHIAAFRGAMQTLGSAYNWADDEAHTAKEVAKLWREIIDQGDSCLEFRQDTCHLYMVANGIETLIYNGQECIDANIADGTLMPGVRHSGLGDKPALDCENYSFGLAPLGTFVLPQRVSSGDTLRFFNTDGGTSDMAGGNIFWWCPSGATYALGSCTGLRGPSQTGDPASAITHASLMVLIAGNYYDLFDVASTPTTFAVPAGIHNELATVMLNYSPVYGALATGAVGGVIEWCKNRLSCHKFDFSVSNQGFTPFVYGGITRAQYLGGGWQSKDRNQFIQFQSGVFPGTVAAQRVTLHFTTAAPTALVEIQYPGSAAPSGTDWNRSQSIAGNNIVVTGTGSFSSMWINCDTGGASLAGKIIDYITIEFDGTNPWGADNC